MWPQGYIPFSQSVVERRGGGLRACQLEAEVCVSKFTKSIWQAILVWGPQGDPYQHDMLPALTVYTHYSHLRTD